MRRALPQQRRDLLQARVPGRVTERVVVPLEVIDVQHDQRDVQAAAGVQVQRAVQVRVERAAVGESRQGVRDAQGGQLVVQGAQRSGQVLQLRLAFTPRPPGSAAPRAGSARTAPWAARVS
ncbi:UvrABC system protein B, uvrB [Deinococcus grandis]|uniref:UvrABC system protein B, uvrB n=1 Tax=Deinococcus grandis TaxID=57498 RepID=A0A100HM73_9DEIO|nr:hypothetical protein DEGR_34760 [Deinococcus grandis]GAQ23289.1 UvrABC system protein B, uvrB [Deinococcus grandis]